MIKGSGIWRCIASICYLNIAFYGYPSSWFSSISPELTSALLHSTTLHTYMADRGRGSRGRGRSSPAHQNKFDLEQFQQFLEFQEQFQQMKGLAIQEFNEGESSDGNPPQKIIKVENPAGNTTWNLVAGKRPVLPKIEPKQPMEIRKILSHMDEAIYPPGFDPAEFNPDNVVGKVFLRKCPNSDYFPIGLMRKEFEKPELLVGDNIWRCKNDNRRIIELKQSIIAAMREMRFLRLANDELKAQQASYAREMIKLTGTISYSDAARNSDKITYKRHKFDVLLSVQTKEEHEDSATRELYNSASATMTLKTHEDLAAIDGMVLIGTQFQPSVWITETFRLQPKEDQAKALFNSGFVRNIDVLDESSLSILPMEAIKVLKNVIQEYP